MKLIDVRIRIKKDFRQAGIDPIDVDFLIGQVLNLRHTELPLVEEISDEEFNKINELCHRRLAGEPVDRIFNHRAFYTLDFKINQYVLSPRADTEILVERALNLIANKHYSSCLDMCTGSGAIAVTINKFSGIDTTAVDISAEAIEIARENANLNGAFVEFVQSNMFEKVKGKFDIILSNPPYIETEGINSLSVEVKNYDPILALDGGSDGLDFYRILAHDCDKYLNKGGTVLVEIGNTQAEQVVKIFNKYKFVNRLQDYGGNDRVLEFRKE